MNRWMLIGWALLLSVGSSTADKASEPSLTPTGIGVAVVGGELPAAQVERLRAFVELNTSIPTRLRTMPELEGAALADYLDPLKEHRKAVDAALVLVYAGPASFEEHAIYRYDEGVAIINATLMQVEDEEQFMRRLERLTMRSMGLLLDVPLVPNPQSAMWTYRTLAELDYMGRNFDPPSLIKIQENAVALGIELMEDSPYLLLRDEAPE